MMDDFTFQYGSKTVRVYLRSGGVTTSRWLYEVDGLEYQGPEAHADDDVAVIKLLVRMDYKKRRDPLEPGRGLYQFKPGRVTMISPEEPTRVWLNQCRDGRCIEGEAEGGAVRLYPPPEARPGSESIVMRARTPSAASTPEAPKPHLPL